MAKKIPSLPEQPVSPDPHSNHSPPRSVQRPPSPPESDVHFRQGRSSTDLDTVCELTSEAVGPSLSSTPSPRLSNNHGRVPSIGSFGAVPRTRSFRSTPSPSPSPRDVRSRRRRLDSLHLDPPRQTGLRNEDDHLFHFGRFFPSRLASFTSSSPPCSNRDTILEGQELYLNFFHERLRNEGLGDVTIVEDYRDAEIQFSSLDGGERHWTEWGNPDLLHNPLWRKAGRDLKVLADAFARSVERVRVRQWAEQVDISTLTMEKFTAMLVELFQGGGITKERILVLFFFCSDVSILAIRSGAKDLLSQLTQWSLLFIKDQVCSWVQSNGGWGNVLRTGMNFVQQSAFIISCAMFITCCAIYIRKNLN